jgi:hephaestin
MGAEKETNIDSTRKGVQADDVIVETQQSNEQANTTESNGTEFKARVTQELEKQMEDSTKNFVTFGKFFGAGLVVFIIAIALVISLSPKLAKDKGQVPRTYHFAVDEVMWNYAPYGYDNCSGVEASLSPHAKTFLTPDLATGLIGATYRRRQFTSFETDGTFSVSRPQDTWAHVGNQGPTMRAAVGETLRVRVRNRSRFPSSLHIMGIPLYSAARISHDELKPETVKDVTIFNFFSSMTGSVSDNSASTSSLTSDAFSSGSRDYICAGDNCKDASSQTLDVLPDETVEFVWKIPDEAGPDPGMSSVGRLYSSLTYEGANDPALSGLLVIVPSGSDASSSNTLPQGVAAERLALFSVSMESGSPYLANNVLDFVFRARLDAEVSPTKASAAATNVIKQAALRAVSPDSYSVPLPSTVSAAEILAALYNSAANAALAQTNLLPPGGLSVSVIDASHPAVVAATSSVSTMFTFPTKILNLNLGISGVTLYDGSLFNSSSLVLVDAPAFVDRFGIWALEEALAPLALAALESEPSFDAANFEESNTMHGLNGLLFCNQKSLTVYLGLTTRWYVAVLGTEVDLHAAHWHGNTLLEQHNNGKYRTDSIQLLPRQVSTADMVAHAQGNWLFHCHITDHIEAGMMAVYNAIPAPSDKSNSWTVTFPTGTVNTAPLPNAPSALASSLNGQVREYFIQAELRNWSYIEGDVSNGNVGSDAFVSGGSDITQDVCSTLDVNAFAETHNRTYTWSKVRFVRYTDKTFTTRWTYSSTEEANNWKHLGLLGPALRAEVGDTMRVWFKNAAPAPFSLHPHGVLYAKGGEGAPYADGSSDSKDKGDDIVYTGQVWPYTWFVPESAGPGPGDTSSVPWLYHGHVHEAGDENTGLVGVIIVTGRGKAVTPKSLDETKLRPADVDREIVLMAKVFDENQAHDDVKDATSAWHFSNAESHAEIGMFYTLNGLAACRLNINVVAGQRIRIYAVSLGNEIDLHQIAISGHSMLYRGTRVSGINLLPGTMYSADTVAQNVPGNWLARSSVIHHFERGMVARFNVIGKPGTTYPAMPLSVPPEPTKSGSLREYFIAAVETYWDYAPLGQDGCILDSFIAARSDLFSELSDDERYLIDGTDLASFTDSVRGFVSRTNTTIGRVYKKARYLGYQNDKFILPSESSESSTGILGPTIRAAVGDVLRIVFRNRLSFATNLVFQDGSAMQLKYLRVRTFPSKIWSAPIPGTSSDLENYAVQPGDEVEAYWVVPASSGPAPYDQSTISWSYSSSISVDHLFAGLVGGLITASNADALETGSAANGANKEYVLAWFISNENRSPYLHENIQKYAEETQVDVEDEGFQESNLKHAVNGRLSCNLQGLDASLGDRVRFHFLGLGSELDMHTPQVHGNMLHTGGGKSTGSFAATVGVHPGARATTDIVAHTPGKWMLECGVNDHWAAGMRALLNVK